MAKGTPTIGDGIRNSGELRERVMSGDRATNFWQQAEHATSRADKARSDELRRAWLIVARDVELAR